MNESKVGKGKKFSRTATEKEFWKRVQKQAGYSGVVSPELYKYLLSGSSQNDRDKIKNKCKTKGMILEMLKILNQMSIGLQKRKRLKSYLKILLAN